MGRPFLIFSDIGAKLFRILLLFNQIKEGGGDLFLAEGFLKRYIYVHICIYIDINVYFFTF